MAVAIAITALIPLLLVVSEENNLSVITLIISIIIKHFQISSHQETSSLVIKSSGSPHPDCADVLSKQGGVCV